MSTLYSEHLHIVNNFGETFQWRLIGIVSIFSEPLHIVNLSHIVNKILLQIVFTIWRVDCTIKDRVATDPLDTCQNCDHNGPVGVGHMNQLIMRVRTIVYYSNIMIIEIC